jgi:type I restriction enzyme S subunit
MSQTLEEVGHALFEEWFPRVITRDGQMSSHSFGEIASASRESLSPLQNPEETFDHYSIPAYDEARLPIVEEGSQIKSNKFIVPADSVLLSKLNPRIPRTWLPAVGNQRRSLCSTEFIVLRPREGWSREFVYSLCNSNTFQDAFSGMVTGTSGSHQRVKPEYLGKLPVQFPSRELVAKFTQVIKPAHARVALNLEQNSTLATLRDALLPKLASGEVGIAQQLHATGSGKD